MKNLHKRRSIIERDLVLLRSTQLTNPPPTLQQLADHVGGSIVGDPSAAISGVCTLSNPRPDCLAFAKSADKLANAQIPDSTAIIAPEEARTELAARNAIIVQNPRYDFARLLTRFFVNNQTAGIAESAIIHPTARIGAKVSIGEYCIVGPDAQIGDRSIVRHHVTIGEGVSVGRDCLIRSSAVVGEEGFGFEKGPDGRYLRIPHLGSVTLGDEVEIGAGTTIARGTIDDTRIGDRTKIDDQVFIAHNCHIGDDVMIIANAEISGSVAIGSESWIGPSACILNGLSIAPRSLVGMGAVVIRNIEEAGIYAGSPARLIRKLDD